MVIGGEQRQCLDGGANDRLLYPVTSVLDLFLIVKVSI
jgi:hypothetical protein